ncbi:MAG: hypothetical protein AAGF68_10255 [Pseudomonadota bacterium]
MKAVASPDLTCTLYEFDPGAALPAVTGQSFTYRGPALAEAALWVGAMPGFGRLQRTGAAPVSVELSMTARWVLCDAQTNVCFELAAVALSDGLLEITLAYSHSSLRPGRRYRVMWYDDKPDLDLAGFAASAAPRLLDTPRDPASMAPLGHQATPGSRYATG